MFLDTLAEEAVATVEAVRTVEEMETTVEEEMEATVEKEMVATEEATVEKGMHAKFGGGIRRR